MRRGVERMSGVLEAPDILAISTLGRLCLAVVDGPSVEEQNEELTRGCGLSKMIERGDMGDEFGELLKIAETVCRPNQPLEKPA